MTPIDVAIDLLAVTRLTRLVTSDTLTKPLRVAVIREAYLWRNIERAAVLTAEGHDPERWPALDGEETPRLAYLVTCPWCASIYVGVGVVLARRYLPGLWSPLARALAGSETAGIVASTLD